MATNPCSQWFWNDWVMDPNLRMCSMAAQGFWMQMLAIAAAATPRGYVKVGDKPCTVGDLAKITGQDRRSVRNWVAELEQNCVVSVAILQRNAAANESQVGYFCRRMVREQNEEIRQKPARARATLTLIPDSLDKIDKPGRTNKSSRIVAFNHNGVTEHRPSFGPVCDPIELAIKAGLRAADGKLIR